MIIEFMRRMGSISLLVHEKLMSGHHHVVTDPDISCRIGYLVLGFIPSSYVEGNRCVELVRVSKHFLEGWLADGQT